MNRFDISILLIFQRIFNGHRELGEIILNILKQTDIKLIRNEYIETHFYNWLMGDLMQREMAYISQNGEQFEYYHKNQTLLGLNGYYTRTKGLIDSFNSPWWKTMSSNILSRRLINEKINSKIHIRISKHPLVINEYNTELILVSDLWRDTNVKEKVYILDKIINVKDEPHQLDSIYISCDLNSHCYLY